MIAAMAKQRQQANGGGRPALKHCHRCYRPVLSAYRGEVTAVGKSIILSATRQKTTGQCACGTIVSWEWEVSRAR